MATPSNYARYVNSIRPDQPLGNGFNAIFLPDPTEGFSWIVSGSHQIEEGTEILLDYGAHFWDYPTPFKAISHAQQGEEVEEQAPPQTAPGIGKEFSSDNTGDGNSSSKHCQSGSAAATLRRNGGQPQEMAFVHSMSTGDSSSS